MNSFSIEAVLVHQSHTPEYITEAKYCNCLEARA